MIALRVYLLGGLIVHKLVWEVLKRRGRHPIGPVRTGRWIGPIKAVKICVLAGLIVQTMLPEVLPIAPDTGFLRAVGVCIYTVGLVLALLGRVQLGDNWSDIENAKVGTHQRLIASGIYRYVRHPIYGGDLFLLFGLELALNSWLVLAVAVLTPFVVRQALIEETMLVDRLAGYDHYARRTKRFVPFVV